MGFAFCKGERVEAFGSARCGCGGGGAGRGGNRRIAGMWFEAM